MGARAGRPPPPGLTAWPASLPLLVGGHAPERQMFLGHTDGRRTREPMLHSGFFGIVVITSSAGLRGGETG